MKSSEDPRHSARILAIQQLFLDQFKQVESTDSEAFTPEELVTADEIEKYDEKLYKSLTEGINEHISEADEIITKYAPQWPIDQIKKVDLQILRMAIYEGFIAKITPPKVAIDEGIELSKELGGASSDKFVNGVLGAIYEEIKQEDKNVKK